MMVFGLVAFVTMGYGTVASAGPVAVCAPVQPAPPVCQAVQPTPTVCAPTAKVVLHNHLADVAHHLHAILAQHHKVRYVVVAQATPAVCQPVKVLPPPPVCQPALPAPAACEPAKQINLLHHFFHHQVVYTYATEQPVAAPTIASPAPVLAPSAPKPPAPPTAKGT